MQRHTTAPRLVLALSLFACGCGDDSDSDSSNQGGADAAAGDVIEIAGEWSSDFGDESIGDQMWGAAIVASFDNDDNVAITRNADDAEFSPGLYNRIVWTEPDAGAFHYCTVAFGLESAEDAEASEESADDSDPDSDGCGDFPWTKLEAL